MTPQQPLTFVNKVLIQQIVKNLTDEKKTLFKPKAFFLEGFFILYSTTGSI